MICHNNQEIIIMLRNHSQSGLIVLLGDLPWPNYPSLHNHNFHAGALADYGG